MNYNKDYNREFFEWLTEVSPFLPHDLSVHDARLLYERTAMTAVSAIHYFCSRCGIKHACVVKIDDKLICISCRFQEVGKPAVYEPLYNNWENSIENKNHTAHTIDMV